MEKFLKSEVYKVGFFNSFVSFGLVKQEKFNFNLYGYQSFRLVYIFFDQFYFYGLDKKEEKFNIDFLK